MTSSHVLIQDPNDISARYSNDDRLGFDGEDDFDDFDGLDEHIEDQLAPVALDEISAEKLAFEAIERFLCRIPPREADLITLYYKNHLKQEQIAKLFNITQAAVSYRLHRGIKRIQFLRTIPLLDRDTFELELGPKFSDQDREILWRMYKTTCQSAIAKQMGLTQGRVRHRFFRSLSRIKELIADEAKETQISLKMEQKKGVNITDAEIQEEVNETIRSCKYSKYWTVFFAISDKYFNILHEVSLPQFQNRGDAQILSGG